MDLGSNCRLGVCFLCLICLWFYVYLSLVFRTNYHWWILFISLVALFLFLFSFIYMFFFFPFSLFVNVYVYASLCDFVCIGCLLPFGLGFCLSFFGGDFCLFHFVFLYDFFSFFLFSWTVWLAGSWCSGWVSGLSLQGGRADSRILDHQKPPGHTWYQLARTLPEIFVSTLRPISTQRPASSSAGSPMPNN